MKDIRLENACPEMPERFHAAVVHALEKAEDPAPRPRARLAWSVAAAALAIAALVFLPSRLRGTEPDAARFPIRANLDQSVAVGDAGVPTFSAEEALPDGYVYASRDGEYYHEIPDCTPDQDMDTMPLYAAEALGKARCPDCIGPEPEIGNSPENLNNLGHSAAYGDSVYFLHHDGKIYVGDYADPFDTRKLIGGPYPDLLDGAPVNLNATADGLYFTADGALWRSELDGADLEKCLTFPDDLDPSIVFLLGEDIYMLARASDMQPSRLVSMQIGEYEPRVLYSSAFAALGDEMLYLDGGLYFSARLAPSGAGDGLDWDTWQTAASQDEGAFLRYDLASGKVARLGPEADEIFELGGRIYYQAEDGDGRATFSMASDGSDVRKVAGSEFYDLHTWNGMVITKRVPGAKDNREIDHSLAAKSYLLLADADAQEPFDPENAKRRELPENFSSNVIGKYWRYRRADGNFAYLSLEDVLKGK